MSAFIIISNNWFARILLILVSFFILQSNVIAVTPSPIIFGQDHHIGSSDTYTYDETENSISAEVDRTGRLSRVLSKEKVGSDGEVMGVVASVAAKGVTNTVTRSKSVLGHILKMQQDMSILLLSHLKTDI